jgi:hypothetical protein
MMANRSLVVLSLAAGAIVHTGVQAQGRVDPPPAVNAQPVRAAPAPRYAAGAVHRFLLGSGWRDLWMQPLVMPPLPLDTLAGGLTPEREGGNKQSITLHFVDAKGNGWVFRSLDKYPSEKLMEGLDGTPVGALIQDQISAMHPVGPRLMAPLLEALGILHVDPVIHVMPDHPRLGEFRDKFAGVMGTLEPKPNEGENDTPGFAGSRKIRDTEEFMEELRESPRHALADRELLRARLLDFIVGDTDRGPDQYNWARFPHPDDASRYLWRPLPRDRDWAFHRPGGIVTNLFAPAFLPKFAAFGPGHSSVESHAVSNHDIDRPLLAQLDRQAFREEVAFVRRALTDSVIDRVLDRLPPSYPESHALWLAHALKSRRDALGTIAEAYYERLATDVDVHATNEADVARLDRRADGSLEVTLSARTPLTVAEIKAETGPGPHVEPQAATPYYRRVFLPSETDEVRVFLYDGDDLAVVSGGSRAIRVRVIGGEGADILADSSASGAVHLYDADGDNTVVLTDNPLDDSEYVRPSTASLVIHRPRNDWAPDWGSRGAFTIDVGHGTAEGVVLGFGRSYTKYGFRRLPHHWRIEAHALSGLREFTPGLEVNFDYRFENAPHSIEIETSWPGYDSFQWFGRGNDTEWLPRETALVRMDRLNFESAFIWRFGQWRTPEEDEADQDTANTEVRGLRPMRGSFGGGPIVRRSTTEAAPGGPFATAQPLGFDALWQAGSRVEFALQKTDAEDVPHRGFKVKASVEGFPGMLDLPAAYGSAAAELNGYVPLIGAVHLAARAGGIQAFGEVPAFDLAAIGGRRTLRGYSSHRFAGDAAAYGALELRVPLGNVALLLPGSLGVFALADAGRVWENGDSPGGWHSAFGGGLWFSVMERVISAAWASGEKGTLHLWLGLPF